MSKVNPRICHFQKQRKIKENVSVKVENLTGGSCSFKTQNGMLIKTEQGTGGVAVSGELTGEASQWPRRWGGEVVEEGQPREAGRSSSAWLRVPGRSGAATASSTEEAGGGRGRTRRCQAPLTLARTSSSS